MVKVSLVSIMVKVLLFFNLGLRYLLFIATFIFCLYFFFVFFFFHILSLIKGIGRLIWEK